jgi:2'-5' RNA ligase
MLARPDAALVGGGSLTFDTVLVGAEGVLLCPQPAGWLETLVRTQRDAVDRHLGPRGWRPFWPHVSLAYSSAVLPVDRIVDALAEPVADAAAVTVVPTVALVAQACDGATYRWRVLREASR